MPNVNLNVIEKHVMAKSVKAILIEFCEKRDREEYSWHRI
jgi:hypothetical protein